ncbi:hypothetical protein [Vibrio scophthalmi]|uniref:Uncharacterized protein n=1 Tax=Vibrio scophthalmi TaxID=45658 RepID=A0A1E3WJP5_9VIBR|nr:hypothetical protein [Vibrio scophthalmi]ODS09727.1 hypothetical protein VSF3289_03248 [Vibrio scophthalmi]
MSHLVKDLIKAHQENKPIHLGPLSGSDFKALINELAAVRKENQ